MAHMQVWYNTVYLRVEATPALYPADWSAAQWWKGTSPGTFRSCIFPQQVCDCLNSWLLCWAYSLIIRKFWAFSELWGQFCEPCDTDVFQSREELANMSSLLTQPGRLKRSCLPCLPCCDRPLGVSERSCVNGHLPPSAGRLLHYMMGQSPGAAYPFRRPSQPSEPLSVRERVRSGRQLQHSNPSWVHSSSGLSLPSSWKTPQFEMMTSALIPDGSGWGCNFLWRVVGSGKIYF